MLREFLSFCHEDHPDIKGSKARRQAKLTARLYGEINEFLKDGEKFPNPKINDLIALYQNLNLSGDIPAFYPTNARRLSLSINSEDDFIYTAIIAIPRNFPELIITNPFEQMAMVVGLASRVRDYHTHRLKWPQDSTKESNLRRAAYISEFSRQIKGIAEREGVPYKPGQVQFSSWNLLPGGLLSLPAGVDYPTSKYSFPQYKQVMGTSICDTKGVAVESGPFIVSLN